MKFKNMHKKCRCLGDTFRRKCMQKQKCDLDVSPLSQKVHGGRFKVCQIKGDRKHCARMANLGLLPGEEMELICPENGSLCVIKVKGGNISLDNESSDNIYVTDSV